MIKILLADDQPLMRDGLKTIIENEKDMTVIGMAANGLEAYDMAKQLMPDVVLMDIRMPLMDGVEATRIIKKELSQIIVLLLTTFDDDEYVMEALAYGADGYLLKSIETKVLLDGIRNSLKGLSIMTSEIAASLSRQLFDKTSSSSPFSRFEDFSEREQDIILCIIDEFTNREIADKFFLSEGTVKNYITGIYRKIGTSDREKAKDIFKKLKNSLT